MKEGRLKQSLLSFWTEQDGVTSIEYALLGVLIAVAIVGSVSLLGQTVKGLFDSVVAAFP
ncbi:MAG TPA: Flp family type IVb pilin [Aromatoleum sp.]|uniref:Flp family type IVb pilin n=1 Tax=Aromatoleum sp. TaxID=2307007 RepID=UPI002B47CA5B|nr:Flp family type IVb pilin [Aromatoleum sp.]HJV26061.1 Flp family type IVb pilin [Aromatoleum sp.]